MSKEDIERQAVDVLRRVQEKLKRSLKWPIDPGYIAEIQGLDMDWGDIPADEEGSIAAMILPTERKIVINENNREKPEGFEESSIAHEIGHWELHIDQNALSKFEKLQNRGINTNVEPFLCRTNNIQRGIEWQAQYFAGCLLMPKFKLEEARKGRNLSNWKHLYAIRDEFGVTISNLTNRLQYLDWIYIDQSTKRIYPPEVAPNRQKRALR